mmetsp:Transcript_7615/g.16716  ORF Transcript_7615/g.16716 Transcript_7615/m.16716 type:complete len:214 (-) Transcript_7615:85-726(-)|eukprot:CAMPEP_0178501076 /NCGR_PEP_ID=MMETSP0696-20121128/16746_1 /TAXON_ID=265572 /ORGANISM="Extubocellulus spinifer, Strain CCMP396" /LENGTH=213 /DNA_ID=CAMNT_0020129979 /DNA_START=23 /DNA_END=664 /DNA_ORIENTATION=-
MIGGSFIHTRNPRLRRRHATLLLTIVAATATGSPSIPVAECSQAFVAPRSQRTRASKAASICTSNISNDMHAGTPLSSVSMSALDEGDDDGSSDEGLGATRGGDDDLPYLEKAWRSAKKPLLRIGAKGATKSHGNSLRELLAQHTVVKVKVNTKPYDTMEEAFQKLKALAEEAGGERGVELISARPSDSIILFGKPGTMDLIKRGEFPPNSNP